MAGHLTWALSLALLVGAPYRAAELFLTARHEARLLDTADRIIAELDALDAPFADLEPEEEDDALVEVSVQPLTLCPDVARPIRRTTGGRT
ncbi:hypothetical protein [Roseomonas indoligenes]|uniref:Uncharacterized protein n=1 Tax=Roseomonas indoligenes TaxID=2820811 RepID=A0A940N2K4_9PROT|nr:hypothetical protein [Pararoseomonas indoligenes]MBP0493057.1 hypothetical protein [Pararoseomonas indoligenes]